ncbi:hypothetical protein TNCV_2136711 [Trichonephila clavipes]|nr:hypothetical protein TNCV_2136711 [Trichonephila clavipes]
METHSTSVEEVQAKMEYLLKGLKKLVPELLPAMAAPDAEQQIKSFSTKPLLQENHKDSSFRNETFRHLGDIDAELAQMLSGAKQLDTTQHHHE